MEETHSPLLFWLKVTRLRQPIIHIVGLCSTSLTSIKEKYIVYKPIGFGVESKLIAMILGVALVLATAATATIATAQVAHADLSKCVPALAKALNDTIPANTNPASASQDMNSVFQCINANGGK